MTFPTYPVSATSTGTVEEADLHVELAALAVPEFRHVDFDGSTITVVTEGTPSPANIAAIDAAIAAHVAPTALQRAKIAKHRRIDERSDDLVDRGFLHNGKKFSMTVNAQGRAAGLRHVATDPGISFPLQINTIDDSETFELSTPAAFNTWHKDMMLAVRAIVDAGTVIKNQVRAATTIEEVEAIVDDR